MQTIRRSIQNLRKDGISNTDGTSGLSGSSLRKKRRNYRNKILNTAPKAVKENDESGYYKQKVKVVENHKVIYLEDNDNIQRLEAKIKDLTKYQKYMKDINKIVRSKYPARVSKNS